MTALKTIAHTKLATVTGINAKTVATTTLYIVPIGYSFIFTGVVIRVTSFTSGGKTTQAVASFGGNSATYDDYIDSATYTVTGTKVLHDEAAEATEYPIYAELTNIKISVETGSNATTETWAVDVFGYLV